MKAKEYFEKYDDDIWKEAHDPAVITDGAFAKLFIDFCTETKLLAEQRKAKSDQSILAIIREQNQKWNAVSNLFEKKYGVSPLNRDGFEIAIKHTMEIS